MQPGACSRFNISEFVIRLGFAEEWAGKLEESLTCNPLDADFIFRLATAYYEVGRPDEALELLDDAEEKGGNSGRFNFARFYSLVVAGRFDDLSIDYSWIPPLTWHLIRGVRIAMAPSCVPRYLDRRFVTSILADFQSFSMTALGRKRSLAL